MQLEKEASKEVEGLDIHTDVNEDGYMVGGDFVEMDMYDSVDARHIDLLLNFTEESQKIIPKTTGIIVFGGKHWKILKHNQTGYCTVLGRLAQVREGQEVHDISQLTHAPSPPPYSA